MTNQDGASRFGAGGTLTTSYLDLPYEEIAATLGVSKGTVSSTISRAAWRSAATGS